MNEMKKTKYHAVGTKSNRKLIETKAKPIPLTHIYMTSLTHIYMTSLTHIHDLSVSCLGTDTTMKSGRAKLLLCTFYSNV